MKKIFDWLWQFFCSVKLGILLLFLIAVTSLVGSFILQRPLNAPGRIEEVYTPLTVKVLEFFDLFDVYHSWWFVLLLLFLAINITVVTIDLLPKFRARAERFSPHLPDDVPYRQDVPRSPKVNEAWVQAVLTKNLAMPQIQRQGDHVTFFSQKGRYAHYSVVAVHVGILLILLGGMLGAKYGFEGDLQLKPGDKAHFFHDRSQPETQRPLGFTVQCHRVWLETYPDGSPKDYFTELSVVDGGEEVLRKTIEVNEPLSYKGVYFYQASFSTIPQMEEVRAQLMVVDRKTERQVPMTLGFEELQQVPGQPGVALEIIDYEENFRIPVGGEIHELGEGVRVHLISGEGNETAWVFKDHPDFDAKFREGNFTLLLKDFSYGLKWVNASGLQVAKHPTIGLVWFGSGVLMVALYVTFLWAHRCLWVQWRPDGITVAGFAHRNPLGFQKIFDRVTGGLSS